MHNIIQSRRGRVILVAVAAISYFAASELLAKPRPANEFDLSGEFEQKEQDIQKKIPVGSNMKFIKHVMGVNKFKLIEKNRSKVQFQRVDLFGLFDWGLVSTIEIPLKNETALKAKLMTEPAD